MYRKTTLLIVAIVFMLALVACGGSDTPPETAAPTAAVPTAEATAVIEPTAEAIEPTVGPTTEPTAETVEPSPVPAGLCPDLPRPALIIGNGPAFEAVEPLADTRCPLPLTQSAAYMDTSADSIYFVNQNNDAGNAVVSRLGPDAVITEIEPTRATGDVFYLLRFAVSEDGGRLAWSHMRPQGEADPMGLLGSLWIGDGAGDNPVVIYTDANGGPNHIISPIRFSADGQTLFFTWEPIGLGGAWSAFNGRYDNLYRVPAAGGEPVKVFDCADAELFLCLGDFRDDGTVAYIDTNKTIHVNGPDGAEMAAIPSAADYAGYPTFSPAGDLYYSEAMLEENTESLPLPEPGTVYRVAAPYTDPPAVVASADGLLVSAMRDVFLDAEHVAVNASADDLWGMEVLDAAGQLTRLEPWPNAYLAAIWK